MVVEFFRIAALCNRKLPNGSGSGFGGEDFADAADYFALGVVEGEELEAVAEAVAVTDDGANLQRVGTERQRNIERNDFAGFEFASERSADAVLSEFGGASPTILEFSGLKHADLHAGVDGEARVAAAVGSGRFIGREFFCRCRHFKFPGLTSLRG